MNSPRGTSIVTRAIGSATDVTSETDELTDKGCTKRIVPNFLRTLLEYC